MHDDLSELLLSAYRFAYQLTMDRHRAEDLAQEAILRAVQKDLMTSEVQLRLWIFRVIKNLWIDEFRSKRSETSNLESANDQPDRMRSAVEQVEIHEQVQSALRAMELLPARQRMVLYLVACEQLTLSQVSQTLDITTDAVKSSLSVARSTMRRICGMDNGASSVSTQTTPPHGFIHSLDSRSVNSPIQNMQTEETDPRNQIDEF